MQLLRKALKNVQYVNYEEDVQDYTELLKIDSTNMSYNFGMAMTLYTNFEEPRSIQFFERAFRHTTDTIGDAYYFLGSAYHLAGNFEKAKKHYEIYNSLLLRHHSFLPKTEEDFLKIDIGRRIVMCDNGMDLKIPSADRDSLINNGKNFIITDVGPGVNSRFDEYGAAFKGDDSVMYFTTRREGTTGSRVDYDDKYYEDICVSYFQDNKWSDCERLAKPVNTRKHEAIINVSKDGKRIYFYKGIDQGTFYYSDLKKDGTWSSLKLLLNKKEVNTNAWETSFYGFATTVADDELFVVSDREGGYGGRDLYVSKKNKEGRWGKLENMGAVINTAYDEDGPYITPDGNTIYFSSSGHNSMGGFDLFRTRRIDGVWDKPQNLGPPLSTPGDDIFITFLHNSNRACYSSSGFAKDSTRDMDIYMIDFCTSPGINAIKGFAKGISTGTITVTDIATDVEIGKYAIKDNKYIIILPLGKEYEFVFQKDSLTSSPTTIYVPSQCLLYDIYQEMTFTKLGDSLYFENAFFDIAKATVNAGDTSYGEFLRKANKSKLENFSKSASNIHLITEPDTLNALVATVKDSIRHTTQTTIAFDNALFDFDKSFLKEIYKPNLNKVVGYLVSTNPRDNIEVAGHTDSKGPDAYNLALSKRRADVVANYLTKEGLEKSRMNIMGYGKNKPVAPNTKEDGSDNPEGRAKNRRTEIIILSTDLGAVIDDYFEGKNVYVLKEINELIGPDSAVTSEKTTSVKPTPVGYNSKR